MTSKRKGKAAQSNQAKNGTKPPQEKTAKAPGRPPGSKNKRYADVKHIPAVCPTCNSTQLRKLRGSKPIIRDLEGVDANGFAYSKVRWQRSICVDCEQLVTVRSYFPAKNNA